jgi:DNA-binding MarR family transcriptional regulator
METIEHERFEMLYTLYSSWSGILLDGMMIDDLARQLGISRAIADHLIDDLEDRGCVAREIQVGEIAITQLGINLIEKLLDEHPGFDPQDPELEIP